jgi:dTMP kinase
MSGNAALIVFEGVEGVGKSTQLKMLVERLQTAGTPCVSVREPGGTNIGNAIRDLLLDPRWVVDAGTEALLFMASRAQLVQNVIRPALATGTCVVADRFFLSTYAYQIAGRRLLEADIRSANRIATNGLVPDLTLLLDLPSAEGLRRAGARSGAHDRMERSGDGFHERVSDAFNSFLRPAWQAAHPECGPIVRIDASGTPTEVASRVDTAIAAQLPRTIAGIQGSHP